MRFNNNTIISLDVELGTNMSHIDAVVVVGVDMVGVLIVEMSVVSCTAVGEIVVIVGWFLTVIETKNYLSIITIFVFTKQIL